MAEGLKVVFRDTSATQYDENAIDIAASFPFAGGKLYLGDRHSLAYVQLKHRNCSSVVSCSCGMHGSCLEEEVQYLQVDPLDDDTGLWIRSYEFIENCVSKGINVTVQCENGTGKSAAVIVFYVMKKLGVSLAESYQLVGRYQTRIKLRPELMAKLIEQEMLLRGNASVLLENRKRSVFLPVQDLLQKAVASGDAAEVKRLLVEKNSSPSYPLTPSGMGPVHLAVMKEDAEVVRLLVEAGADINDFGNHDSPSVLQFAVQACMHDLDAAIELTDLLLSSDRNKLTSRKILGWALHFVCGMGCVPLVQRLLEAGADPNYYMDEDDYCITPLVCLSFEVDPMEGHAEVCRMLLAAGADPRFVSRSQNPLEYAEENERDDLIPLLKEATE